MLLRMFNCLTGKDDSASRNRPLCAVITLVVGWTVFTHTTIFASEADRLRGESDSVHTIVREAIAEGDGGKLASVFTSDGAVMSPGGQTIEGRLTIRATATLLMRTMGTARLTTVRYDLSLIDDLAYETGEYTLKQPLEEGKSRVYSGKYTIVWKVEEKKWRIHRVIGLRR